MSKMASKTRRRSQSVSAVSRKESNIATKFSNSRDNPLFWATADDATEKSSEISKPISSFVDKNSRNGNCNSSSGGRDELRGRSVTRSLSGKNGIGRSLSTTRGRSVSRPHRYSSDESEKGQKLYKSTRPLSTNGTKPVRNGLVRTTSAGNKVDMHNRTKNARVLTRGNEVSELSEDDSTHLLKISHVEDGISTSYLSEAEARTIQDFYDNIIMTSELSGDDMPSSETYEAAQSEVKYAISDIQDEHISAFRRNNVNTIENIIDMPSDVVDHGAGEFISGIKREYAIKLEEAEERARELRADLAIEEHRARELNRMLKEIPPDTSSVRKPRRGRRASSERRNMSERLTEEAMAYFDECVSLSTFDSSDFSASEDIPRSSLGADTSIDTLSRVKGRSNTLNRYDQVNDFHQKQVQQIHGSEDSAISVNSSNMKPTTDTTQPCQFSYDNQKSQKSSVASADIQSYIKHFEKDVKKDIIGSKYTRARYYDAQEYITNAKAEHVLIDRVLYKRHIESGGLVLCAGSSASFMHFSSFM